MGQVTPSVNIQCRYSVSILSCRLLLLGHERMNRGHASGLTSDIDLDIRAGASQPNHQPILCGFAFNSLTGEISPVSANVVNFPTVVVLAKLHMVTRYHRAIQNDIVFDRSTNANDGLFLKSPALYRRFVDGMQ